MIGKITGTITEIDGNCGLIETASGLSYLVHLTPSVLTIPIPARIELYTHLQVREDNWSLYGFDDKGAYKLFTLLLSVDKIGPKLAFTIVSKAEVNQILTAISSQDVDFFSRIPGIGKKTAQKILFELVNKLGETFEPQHGGALSENDKLVVEALITLGFKRNEALAAVNSLEKKDGSIEERIQQALQIIGSNKK